DFSINIDRDLRIFTSGVDIHMKGFDNINGHTICIDVTPVKNGIDITLNTNRATVPTTTGANNRTVTSVENCISLKTPDKIVHIDCKKRSSRDCSLRDPSLHRTRIRGEGVTVTPRYVNTESELENKSTKQ